MNTSQSQALQLSGTYCSISLLESHFKHFQIGFEVNEARVSWEFFF